MGRNVCQIGRGSQKNNHYKQNVILKSVKWEHAMASWGVQKAGGEALSGGTEVHVRGGRLMDPQMLPINSG